eukprot:gene19140-25748_t
MRKLFATSSLAANLQTNLQSVADMARQSMTKTEAPGDLSSLQQVPEGISHEARLLRDQVEVLKIKNILLQKQASDEKNHAAEAVQLKAEVEDLKVKLVFALKRSGAEAIVPKVVEELQRQKNCLADDLATAEADAHALRVENSDLRFKIGEVKVARLEGQAAAPSTAPAGSSDPAGKLQRLNEIISQLQDQLHVQAQVAELATQEHAKTIAGLQAKLAETETEVLQTSHQASQGQAVSAAPLPAAGWGEDADQDGWGLDDEPLEPLNVSAASQSKGAPVESQAVLLSLAWDAEKAILVKKVQELEGALGAAQITVAQAVAGSAAWDEERRALDVRIQELEAGLSAAEVAAAAAGAGSAAWDEDRRALDVRIQELEAGLSAAEVAAAAAGAGSAAWDQERMALDATIKELDTELRAAGLTQKQGPGSEGDSDLEAQISALTQQLSAVSSAKVDLESQVSYMTTQIAGLSHAQGHESSERVDLEAQILYLEAQVLDLKAQVPDLTKGQSHASAEKSGPQNLSPKEGDKMSWVEQRSVLEVKIQELEQEMAAMSILGASTLAKASVGGEERSQFEAKILDLEEELRALSSEPPGWSEEKTSWAGERRAWSEEKAVLEAQIEKLDALGVAWAEEKSVFETKIAVLEHDKTALSAAGSAAWAEERGVLETKVKVLEDGKAALSAARNAAWAEERGVLEGKARVLEQLVMVETAKVCDLEEQLKASESVILVCDRCPTLTAELDELSRQQVSGSETKCQLEAEVCEKTLRCDSLARDVQSLGLERAQLARKNVVDLANLDSMTGSNAGLEKLLDAAEAHNEDLRKDVARLEKELLRASAAAVSAAASARAAPSKAAAQNQGPSPSPEHVALMVQIQETAQLFSPFFASVRASHSSLPHLASSVAELDAIMDGIASHQAEGGRLGGATVIQSQTHAQAQARIAGAVSAVSTDSAESAELSKLKGSNTQLKEYNKSLREEMASKQQKVSSLEMQVEELSASLSKLGSNYARQFERYEADHSAELDDLRQKHAADLAKLEKDLNAARDSLEQDKKEAEKKLSSMKKGPSQVEKEAKDRAERLLQELKEKAQEVEDLYSHATLSSKRVATAEAATAKAVRKLEQAQIKYSGLETASAELAVAKKRVEVAEGKVASLEAAAAATGLEMDDLQVKSVELNSHCQLLEEEIMHLKTLVEERDEFENQVQQMKLELADTGMLKHRLEAAESARDRHQADATRTGMMLSNLEQRLLQLEEDNEKLGSALDEERRRGAASVRSWAADLDGLAAVSRNRWPAPVRKLVEEIESRSANENQEFGLAAVQGARAAVAEEIDELQAQVQSLEQSLESSKAAVLRLEARVAQATEAGMAAAELHNAELVSKVEGLRAQHYAAQEAGELESSACRKEAVQWKENSERVGKELMTLRNRTRELVEEKETEVESLRIALRNAAKAPPATVASGSAVAAVLDSSRMSAGGARPPGIVSSNSLSTRPSSAMAEGEDSPEHWLTMSNRYKQAYDESEHTHTLRNQTEAALKEEVAKLQALTQLADGDVSYMRSVIISGFMSGELPKEGSIFPVLSRLLRFTPQETDKIMSCKSAHHAATSVVTSSAAALSYFLGTGTKQY